MELKKYTQYSLFGYKILNSFHSILSAYFLLLFQILVTPYFGIEKVEYLAGLFFIFIINISIIILITNALFRISKTILIVKLLVIPLLLYLPFSLDRVIFTILKIKCFLF